MVADQCCLPPLFITAIQDVQDVTMLEREALGGTVIVLGGVIVKQGSASTETMITVTFSLEHIIFMTQGVHV